MKIRPNLSLSADNPTQLIRQLSAIDTTVPLINEGRTKEHREQYMMARLLATIAHTPLLKYPLQITHAEQPDFVFDFSESCIGVECVEANHPDNYHIEEIRERMYPESMNFGQQFVAGTKTLTQDEKYEIASGQYAGTAWASGSMQRNWVEGMQFVIDGKTTKLRQGNYLAERPTWLLIHDEWPNPIHFYPDKVREAAAKLHVLIAPLLNPPAFVHILLASGDQLFQGTSINQLRQRSSSWN